MRPGAWSDGEMRASAARPRVGSRFELLGRIAEALTVSLGEVGPGLPLVRAPSAEDARAADLATRLRVAVLLLEKASPAHASWLRRYVRRILVVPAFGARASFHRASRSILVRIDSAEAHDAVALSAILAHECTHARISALLRPGRRSREERLRIERRCVQEHLRVLTVQDEAHYLVGWSRALLEDSAVSAEALIGGESRQRAAARGFYRRMREMDVPTWLARLLARLAARSPW